MYWSWIWGPVGLLLATPLTACIKVIGDYIPALSFFSILLGSERPSEDYHEFYRKMLELDREGARTMVVQYFDEHGFDETINEVIVPTVIMAAEEFDHDNISVQNLHTIINTARELIVEVGNRFNKIQRPPRLRVVGACAPGEVHSLALLILVQMVRKDDVATTLVSENKTIVELREFIRGFAPDVVFLSLAMADALGSTLELVAALREDSAQLAIVAGGLTAIEHSEQLIEAGCTLVCATIAEGHLMIRNRIADRIRTRRALWSSRLPAKRSLVQPRPTSSASRGLPAYRKSAMMRRRRPSRGAVVV
jgi:methanogenic corrinoid protein MtbC1